MTRYPKLYQWLLVKVKPERDANRDKDLREKWWLHRRNNEEMRQSLAGLPQYIATVMTAKHRVFQFLEASILPDQMLVVMGLCDAWVLGVLSSTVHVRWALAMGGRLGVGNDPRYNKSRCFETFPFPAATEAQKARIRELGEQLDAHRKRQQAQHPDLTLTGMYNVLEKLRALEHHASPLDQSPASEPDSPPRQSRFGVPVACDRFDTPGPAPASECPQSRPGPQPISTSVGGPAGRPVGKLRQAAAPQRRFAPVRPRLPDPIAALQSSRFNVSSLNQKGNRHT